MTWSAHPPAGAGDQPTQSDLRQAARKFGAQAATFRSIMPAGAPPGVDVGLPEFDLALTQVLELIGGLHAELAAAIARHGSGLQQASKAEQDVVTGSELARFAEVWAGGDIHGLQALATTLYGHALQITDVTAVPEQQVSRLAGRGWPAGSAFASGRRDSVTAEALVAVIAQTAAIVDGLAVELAAIQNALEEEAYVASRYGAKIGTDGQPPPVPAGPQADASERHWVVAYKLAHERAMANAQRTRRQAATELTRVYEQITTPQQSLAMASPQIIASFLRTLRTLSRAACPPVVKDV